MVNILLKAFDGPPYVPMIKAAFRDRDVGTCFYVTNKPDPAPDIPAQRIVWVPANDLRTARYPDVDWNAIPPLDAPLIDAMRECEATFLFMLERYAVRGDIPLAERKRQYLKHLQYWNYMLDKEKIGLYLLNHIPHQCFDYVMYELCRHKGIPTYNLERSYIVDGVFMIRDFKRSAEQLIPALEHLRKEYADPSKEIPLSESYETFYKAQTTNAKYEWLTLAPAKDLRKRNLIARWGKKLLDLLRNKPLQFVKTIVSPYVWSRKMAQYRATRYYESLTKEPDLSVPYIYAPLHMQPEASTCPMAGAYASQELMIQLIAAHAPPEVRIYVKEHPMQTELCRSEEFYRSMSSISSVTFIPRDSDTYALSQHAMAVAIPTGTAGFEALFRQTPVLMFGQRFFRYAPGVHLIRTAEDCKRAMKEIFEEKKRPSLRDLRLFLRAVEDCTVPYEGGPEKPGQASRLERARVVGEMMRKELDPIFS